jgi:hypothetical protein
MRGGTVKKIPPADLDRPTPQQLRLIRPERIDRTAIDSALGELERLAGYETHNPNSSLEKDAYARHVLRLAGKLVGPLLRWAINHETGQVLADVRPARLPMPHKLSDAKYMQRIKQRNLAANSHDNELRGARYGGGDPVLDRRIAARVLGLISSGMGFHPGVALAAALEALDQGETVPLLALTKKGRHFRPATLDNLRLHALMHIEFRHGCGMLKRDAVKVVAEKFGKTVDAIHQWAKRLPKEMDPEYVSGTLENVYLRGMMAAALADPKRRSNIPSTIGANFDSPADRAKIERLAGDFNDAELLRAGMKYQEIERASARLPIRRRR